MNIALLERDLDTKRQAAADLLKKHSDAAQAENRLQTEAEKAEIEAVLVEARALQAKLTAARGEEAMFAELNRMSLASGGATARTAPERKRFLSMGEQFVAAPEYSFFKDGRHRTQSSWRSPSVELDPRWGSPMAATLTEDPASGGAVIVPQYLPGILPLGFRRLVVADLMASGTTDSNLISYMVETVFTNAAAPVLEGGVKPESTLTFAAVQEAVRKIAHWLPVTEEMLEDAPQIRSYIDARLRLGVQIEEEDQLLNGTGVAPELLGILRRPGLTPDKVRTDPETNADALLKQMFAIQAASLYMPDGIVMHPSNWATTVLTKTTTGEYLAGGPFAAVQTPTLWGLPVAVTPAIAATTAFVGAFKQASQVFRKGGIRVEASNSHADFFIKNLVAIRAEERLALAVYRPAAFGEVTALT